MSEQDSREDRISVPTKANLFDTLEDVTNSVKILIRDVRNIPGLNIFHDNGLVNEYTLTFLNGLDGQIFFDSSDPYTLIARVFMRNRDRIEVSKTIERNQRVDLFLEDLLHELLIEIENIPE